MATINGTQIRSVNTPVAYGQQVQAITGIVPRFGAVDYTDGFSDGYADGFADAEAAHAGDYAAGFTAGHTAGYTEGFADGVASVTGFAQPQLHVLTTFSADFSTARDQTWEATLPVWPSGGQAIILVRVENRNEMIVARDADGRWRWPFDVEPDNAIDLVSSPGTVQLKPRGGWPASLVEIQIAAAKIAQVV